MNLAEFLTARLDEDEQAARAADDDLGYLIGAVEYNYPKEEVDERHALRHAPPRVLAEVNAKRRLLDWLAREDERALDNNLWWWDGDGARKLMALPYADHPDYDEAWRP